MKKSCLLLWLAAAIVLSCITSCGGNPSVRKVLGDAERLMNDRPDSALYVLQGLDMRELTGKRLKAEHSLLLSMALDKNFIDLTTDSLINVAVEYYRSHRMYERRFMALYYQGRVYENAGQYNKAMLSFTEAEQMIDMVDNDFAKGLLYAHLGDLYDNFFNYAMSMKAHAKSEYYHGKANRTVHRNYSKISLACVYINLNQYDKAEHILKSVMEWGNSNNLAVSLKCREVLSYLYMRTDNTSEYLALFEKEDGEELSLNSLSLAYQYALKNDKEKALNYLDSAWFSTENVADTLNMYDCAYRVYKRLGNFEAALFEYEKLFFAQDTAARAAMRQPLLEVQKDYFHSLAENRALELKNGRISFAGGFIIVLLLLVLLITYYRNKLLQKQRNLDDYMDLRQELEKLLSDKNDLIADREMTIDEKDRHIFEMEERISDKDVEISAVHTKVSNLFLHQYELLNQLCKICYENPGSNKANAIYSKVRKEIESFKYDEVFLNKLEQIVNEYNNDVMRKLREGLPMLGPKDYRMMCFFYAGFSAKAISLFTDDTINNIYVKKKRLRDKIMETKPQNWEEILFYMR